MKNEKPYPFHKKFYLSEMKAHEDQRYIEAMREGNHTLLGELYELHAPSVANWVKQNNGSLADARDVFQEAMVAIYNKACDASFILTCPIGALLFQISRNKWIDQIRKKTKDEKVRIMERERYDSAHDAVSQVEAIQEEEIRQSKLNKAFAQLSELCQKLLKLYAEGLDTATIQAKLEMVNVNTLYRRKNACTERWRTLYHES